MSGVRMIRRRLHRGEYGWIYFNEDGHRYICADWVYRHFGISASRIEIHLSKRRLKGGQQVQFSDGGFGGFRHWKYPDEAIWMGAIYPSLANDVDHDGAWWIRCIVSN